MKVATLPVILSVASLGVGVNRGSQFQPIGFGSDIPRLVSGWEEASHMNATNIDAARIALLALYAGLPEADRVDRSRLILLPAKEPTSWANAAIELAKRQKPAECKANSASGFLVVTCGELSENWRPTYDYQIQELVQGKGPIGALREDCQPSDGSVLVTARDSSVRVNTDALEEWARSYVITSPVGVSSRDADTQERNEGAVCVIEFGRVDDVSSDDDVAREIFRLHPTLQRKAD